MKKTPKQKKIVTQTVALHKETQATTTEKIAGAFNADDFLARRLMHLGEKSDAVTRYLENSAHDALERTRHITPEVADVKAHPLPAYQDLVVNTFTGAKLKDVTDEITDYFENERAHYIPGMMRGLDDVIISYSASFVSALRHLLKAKIAVCDTLGNADAKAKMLKAFETLPDFATLEDLERYCARNLNDTKPSETERIVEAWRKDEPTSFPNPTTFKTAFRLALMLDAEATEEINATGKPSAFSGYTPADRKRDEQTAKNAKAAAAKTIKQLNAKSDGGKKGAATRNAETNADKTLKETIKHEVRAMKREWDKLYPNRHKPGNKDHSNNMIYRTVASKHLKANGEPILKWETIKGWFKSSNTRRRGNK